MFRVGDLVVYGIHGVCRIADEEKRVVDRKRVTYLVLEPLGQQGSRYLVPTHNETAMAKLKAMLSRQELEELLRSDQVRRDVWIADEGQRKQHYRELVSSGDREQVMEMLYTLYQHRGRQQAAGKKIHMCDDNFLRDAEKLLSSEVSIVMELTPEDARHYIREALQ